MIRGGQVNSINPVEVQTIVRKEMTVSATHRINAHRSVHRTRTPATIDLITTPDRSRKAREAA